MSIELNQNPDTTNAAADSSWDAEHPAVSTNAAVEEKKKLLSKVVGTPLMYWSGHVANWTFVLTLIVIGAFAITAQNWTQAPAFFLGGFFLWGFSEYIFHRWAYHKNETLFAVGHLMHHDTPMALIGMPWAVNMLMLSGLCALSTLALGRVGGTFLFAGFWLGHIWYTIIHHGIHHWEYRGGWFKRLKNHHKIHHRLPDKNLGVTTIFWDQIFKSRV